MGKENIVAALVGLGRSVDGNKNRPNVHTHFALLAGIDAVVLPKKITRQEEEDLLAQLHKEKYKLISRCSTCEKQCGRNEDYSFLKEDNAFQKYVLWSLAQSIGMGIGTLQAECGIYQNAVSFLYEILFLLGKDTEAEGETAMELSIIRGGQILESVMRETVVKDTSVKLGG